MPMLKIPNLSPEAIARLRRDLDMTIPSPDATPVPPGYVLATTAIAEVRAAYEAGRKHERDHVGWVLDRFEVVLGSGDGLTAEESRLTIKAFRSVWEKTR